jgi:hypothetical protein
MLLRIMSNSARKALESPGSLPSASGVECPSSLSSLHASMRRHGEPGAAPEPQARAGHLVVPGRRCAPATSHSLVPSGAACTASS